MDADQVITMMVKTTLENDQTNRRRILFLAKETPAFFKVQQYTGSPVRGAPMFENFFKGGSVSLLHPDFDTHFLGPVDLWLRLNESYVQELTAFLPDDCDQLFLCRAVYERIHGIQDAQSAIEAATAANNLVITVQKALAAAAGDVLLGNYCGS